MVKLVKNRLTLQPVKGKTQLSMIVYLPKDWVKEMNDHKEGLQTVNIVGFCKPPWRKKRIRLQINPHLRFRSQDEFEYVIHADSGPLHSFGFSVGWETHQGSYWDHDESKFGDVVDWVTPKF